MIAQIIVIDLVFARSDYRGWHGREVDDSPAVVASVGLMMLFAKIDRRIVRITQRSRCWPCPSWSSLSC